MNNTFTARLLLLLESKPLLGKAAYDVVISDVIAAYWKDYPDYKNDFQPVFLANDILRMWRTFCVNYEARTQSVPPEKKAKRKLKNYKLKHSRVLTCYSALLFLLAVFVEKETVTPEDVQEMVAHTPTERLELLLKSSRWTGAHAALRELIERYEGVPEEHRLPRRSDRREDSRWFAAFEISTIVLGTLSAMQWRALVGKTASTACSLSDSGTRGRVARSLVFDLADTIPTEAADILRGRVGTTGPKSQSPESHSGLQMVTNRCLHL